MGQAYPNPSASSRSYAESLPAAVRAERPTPEWVPSAGLMSHVVGTPTEMRDFSHARSSAGRVLTRPSDDEHPDDGARPRMFSSTPCRHDSAAPVSSHGPRTRGSGGGDSAELVTRARRFAFAQATSTRFRASGETR